MTSKPKKPTLPPRLAKKSTLTRRRNDVNQTLKKVLESEVLPPSKGQKHSFDKKPKGPLGVNGVVKDVLEAENFIKPRKMACGGVAKIRLGQSTPSGC
ncbi:hypothetical protein Cva_00791 [Caedimonas varicaedens]|uniref:Uncharacterized protein n=1 Tax=Caedimonas varicaedens TaxID=1629334 RepID=A0A0K8MD50_9PROT|nr:hypothetical protein Cva_00791 [Caedimonas varicaedens]